MLFSSAIKPSLETMYCVVLATILYKVPLGKSLHTWNWNWSFEPFLYIYIILFCCLVKLFWVFSWLEFLHSSCAGAPGGLSADGQRRRMAGCGAPGSSVSRSSPSILPTSPAKRLRRCFCRFLSSCPDFSSLIPSFCSLLLLPLLLSLPLFLTPLSCTSRKHTHRLSNKQLPLRVGDPGLQVFLLCIDPQPKTTHQLIITQLLDCARSSPKMESLFFFVRFYSKKRKKNCMPPPFQHTQLLTFQLSCDG